MENTTKRGIAFLAIGALGALAAYELQIRPLLEGRANTRSTNAGLVEVVESSPNGRMGIETQAGVTYSPEARSTVSDEVAVITEVPKSAPLVDNGPFYDRFHQAPEYTAGRTKDISEIIIHTTEGSGSGAENWLTTADPIKVSAHYLVMEDGEVVGLVNDTDTAYHCRGHNEQSIGIEFAGYHDGRLNDTQVFVGQELISNLANKYGLKKSDVKAHSDLDPSRRKDPGEENMKALLEGVK